MQPCFHKLSHTATTTTTTTTTMSIETLTFNTTDLFLTAHKTLSISSSSPTQPPPPSPPFSFSLLSSHSPLPPIASDVPHTKIIPASRFLVDAFSHSGDFSISYFLSHFHSDHYTGLSPCWSKGIIFCSETTARLVVEVLKISPLFVVQLPLNHKVLIDGNEVTLIDANHCPGAVQFLFKIASNNGKLVRYVHTGDFRYNDLMKLEPALSEFIGSDAVFLDTTYCNPKFVFPSQEESIDYVVSVIERIGVENRSAAKRVLFLVATYVIGKEKILVEVSRRCNCKIHVDNRKMAVLRILGFGDDSVFTEDESGSDVHVVGWNVLGETWPFFRPNFIKMKEIMVDRGYSRVVGFVPTGWTYEVKRNKFAVRTKDSFEIHLVPYSEHSNYKELREYVEFLKPKKVIPTVGLDVESIDSKHAIKMRKHFSGLVDEMANKQEFLMGFTRASLQKDEEMEHDPGSRSNRDAEYEQVVEHPDMEISVENAAKSLASVHHPASQNSTLLTDKEKECFMQEVRECLPLWVTQDQILELTDISGGNVVDAVSYFYEHETEFHEQSGASVNSLFTSQSQSMTPNDYESSLKYGSVESSLQKVAAASQNQGLKSLSLKQSAGSSISPGKRRRNQDKKTNKKARIHSNIECGVKQSTITKFFNKLAPNVSQVGSVDPVSVKCLDKEESLPSDDAKPYKEALEQFIQIIDGSESSRRYAASIIEKAGGDINLALEMHYNNGGPNLGDCEMKMDVNSKLVHAEGTDCHRFSSQQSETSLEPGSRIHQSSVESSSENVSETAISLPLDKYLPVEDACWRHGQPAPYIHLARTFDLVEGEKGKIKATTMLCNMFRSLLALSPKDVLPAVYLCTNKIAADHENMELNIGGSLVTAALQEACGTNRSRIRDMYNSLGDLGDVAQECRQTQSVLIPLPPLLIQDVFSALREISMQAGSGSTGRKKNLIVGLMRSCREKEMKFLVRTLVRNLRIGAMMRTVLPALAQAVVMNSLPASHHGRMAENFKEILQSVSAAVVEAYNIVPNLDVLVPSLMSKGIEFSSTTLTMVPGVPIRPMLAKITNGLPQALKLFENKAFTCEYKYDGQRAQIHKLADGSVRIFSRNGDETTSRFPDVVHIIQDACKSSVGSFIIDAEVVGVDRKNGGKLLSFQELSSRERGSKASLVAVDSIKVDICIFVFDIMFINGEQLLSCPLRQRRKYIRDLFNGERSGYLEYAKEITIGVDGACVDRELALMKLNAFLEDAFRSSCEGIMVKSLDADAGYFPSKRADTWLKVKRDYVEGLNDSLDLVPIGAWHGNGRKAGWYSPFLMACHNPDTEEFESVCRVMSGFSDSFYIEMKEFFSGDKILSKKPPYYRTAETPDMWFSPELVWAIRGADLTVSPVYQAAVGLVHPSRGISLRFPRFIHPVTDRRPEDCSTSADIAEMFHAQTRKMAVSTTGPR
ncbi:hypothetical protein Ancab_006359 [Ancistrocladus abbreviatus]